MLDLEQVPHHHAIEEITQVLSTKTQNNDKAFFRVIVAYSLSVIASSMRTTINTKDRGNIPVNTYTLALSPSGTGKGFSLGILENEIVHGFRQNFVENTLPDIAQNNMWSIATKRAVRKQTDEKDEFTGLQKEYNDTGAYPYSFDSGSAPAIKQVRQKLLLAGAGAINLQIDEIGSNLIGSTEVLNTYLELYDQGMIKPKLTKNTADNKRHEEIEGKTPSNMLLFGTPSKLLDGGTTEDAFYSFLETGYGRRCIFAMGHPEPAANDASAAEIYASLINPANEMMAAKWASHLTSLATPDKFNWSLDVADDVGIECLQYRILCERAAKELPLYDEIRKTEMSHRYFKAMKLAGALAFIDESFSIEMSHLHSAIKLVEESGAAFQKLLTREKPYMKLAHYVANCGQEVTHADLHEALPFYKASASARSEMMTLATAFGIRQHIILKKTFVDGIEFFTGDTLKETSLDQIDVSYSTDFAYNYGHERVPFDQLHNLVTEPGYHWANHAFVKEHRAEENVIQGFNMVVLDVDGGVRIDMVHELLKEYTFMTYTTKRHTDAENRFRIMLPISYELSLDRDDYRDFMENIVKWLPFAVDESANQRSRKWMSNDKAIVYYNTTDRLLDVLPFVPKTAKNEQFQKEFVKLESLDNLERWFAERIASGNRSNQLIKFALALVDNGMTYNEVEQSVLNFNRKLSEGLDESELRRTVLVTVAKRLQGLP